MKRVDGEDVCVKSFASWPNRAEMYVDCARFGHDAKLLTHTSLPPTRFVSALVPGYVGQHTCDSLFRQSS